MDQASQMRRALLAVDGLTVGLAFGERFTERAGSVEDLVEQRSLPLTPWAGTGETEMALAVLDVLQGTPAKTSVDRDALATALGARYRRDPGRGYDDASHWVLASIAFGLPWADAAESALSLPSPLGHDAALRAAAIGAYFAPDLDVVVREARACAEVTDARPEGSVAAAAVGAAAAIATQMGEGLAPRSALALVDAALAHTQEGATRSALLRARGLVVEPTEDVASVAREMAASPVVYGLYCAARTPAAFDEVMWAAVHAVEGRNVACAVAGAVAALAAGSIPAEWLSAREPLA